MTLDDSGEKVIAPFVQDQWREGLEYMKGLCQEGLLPESVFTDDKTQFMSVLNNEETVWMKLAKEQTKSEQETQKKSRKKKSALAGSGEFTEAEENLFETLRKLRAQIAKEEKVPPYIVFSDKTLAHMCIIKPVNKEEMLSVSGVGEFKYEKYGERFLAAVREQTE